MAPNKNDNTAEGDVTHLRIPSELKTALKQVAEVKGRSLTQHIIHVLDEHQFGPREYRLIKGKLGRN
jgi:hypothetical protein